MKKTTRMISGLLVITMLSIMALMTSCTNEPEEEEAIDRGFSLILDLESDSEAGNTWKFEQSDKLFSCEEMLSEEEGDGEIQSFVLRPVKAGSVTVKFSNKASDTTYTYECLIKDSLDDVTIESSKGESGGSDVDAPELVADNN